MLRSLGSEPLVERDFQVTISEGTYSLFIMAPLNLWKLGVAPVPEKLRGSTGHKSAHAGLAISSHDGREIVMQLDSRRRTYDQEPLTPFQSNDTPYVILYFQKA